MQYDVSSPDAYLDALEQDWRKETLLVLRTLILRLATDAEEIINYKMLGYRDERGIIFHLNAQRQYVSLYVGDIDKVDPRGQFTQGIDRGKGCLRFKRRNNPNSADVEAFVKQAINLWKEGVDIGC